MDVSYIGDEASVVCLKAASKGLVLGESCQTCSAKSVLVIHVAVRVVEHALVVIGHQRVSASQTEPFRVVLKAVRVLVETNSISQHIPFIASRTRPGGSILLAAFDPGVAGQRRGIKFIPNATDLTLGPIALQRHLTIGCHCHTDVFLLNVVRFTHLTKTVDVVVLAVGCGVDAD